MKDIFPEIIGNSLVKKNIGHDIRAGKNSHAYIIEGDYGSGKKTIAKAIAAAVSCEHRYDEEHCLPCGACGNCNRISKAISGDVVWINSGDKATIGVDVIRDLRSGLYVTPNDSEVRTYIIESAEKMTPQAQNALLLTLEEPPDFVMFLLLTEDSTKLLETIRSRAQTVRCEVFGASDVAAYLRDSSAGSIAEKRDPERFFAAVSISGGSLGKAKELLSGRSDSSEFVRFRSVAKDLVSSLCTGKLSPIVRMIPRDLPKSSAEVKRILFLADNAIRDLCAIKKTDDENKLSLAFFINAEEAFKSVRDVPFKKLLHIHECLCKTIGRLESNVSIKTAMTDLALESRKYRR